MRKKIISKEWELKLLKDNFWNLVEDISFLADEDCWNWIGSTRPSGYGAISFRGIMHSAHKVSYCIYKLYGDFSFLFQTKDQVLHTCDNPLCINPGHLFIGTQKENIIDCISKGRFTGTKLDKEKVLEIRRLAKETNMLQKDIGKLFGVNNRSVCNVINYKSWRHV